MVNEEVLQCYNRGCGQKFTTDTNTDDSCRHHPGEPFFHDAYKGWSCCNKKCTDFTEFLNIKGCTVSKHSNVKPPEPEKPVKDCSDEDVVEVKPQAPPPPQVRVAQARPPFETALRTIQPEIAPILDLHTLEITETVTNRVNSDEIPIGTNCKNSGCTSTYQGPDSQSEACTYHPGCPIFHEGLKFWSCCQKRTTDFNAFLNQIGCEHGKHLWFKEQQDKSVKCRWDFHQTGTHVIVSIYAKNYCIKESSIKLNPVRLCATLVFPQQSNATFDMDIELSGVIDVDASKVSMYGTKVEITLKKRQPERWTRLEVPKNVGSKPKINVQHRIAEESPQIDAVDLDDL